MVDIKMFDNREQLIDALSQFVLNELKSGIENRGGASMLLSGGTTPGPLYEKMSNAELDWKKVWFAPTDERWVEPDHQDSNELLIRKTLLIKNAKDANYIGLKSIGNIPEEGMDATEQRLSELPLPLDIVLLGMGEDGHFASLFPNLPDTKIAMDENCKTLCHPIKRGESDVDRMTISYNGILQSRQVVILFFGSKKLDVLETAAKGANQNLPISYLLAQDGVPVSLYWAE